MESLLRLWKSEDVPHAAKAVFTFLWELIGCAAGTLEQMSVYRLAMLCRLSEGKIRDRLKSLERCGLVEREETGCGEFTLYVFLPFAPKVERPKKNKPTELFDYMEKHSENPAAFQSEKPNEKPRGEPSEIPKSRKRPEIAESPPPDKPPKVPENTRFIDPDTQAAGNRLAAIAQQNRERCGIANRDHRQRSVAECLPKSSPIPVENAKKSESLYMSNDSIDRYINISSIDSIERVGQIVKKHAARVVEAKAVLPAKEQEYLWYMLAIYIEEGSISVDNWKNRRIFIRQGKIPGKCFQEWVKRFGFDTYERIKKLAVDFQQSTSRARYYARGRKQLAGVR